MTHPELHIAPVRQYRTAREDAAFLRRTDRRAVRVWGRDPVRMIQGLITNDIAGAPEGQGVYAAMLTPKGKMVADLRAFRVGDEVLLETDAGALDGLTDVLKRFVPPLFARWAVIEDAGVIGVYGPAARDAIGRIELPPPPAGCAEDAFAVGAGPRDNATGTDAAGSAAGPDATLDSCIVVRTAYTGDDGYDVLARGPALDALEEALLAAGVRRIGFDTLEVLRIEAGRPRWGAELTPDVIPLEAGLMPRAISTSKGCYTGQEVIVRILHRGHVNWHLRGLIFDDHMVRDLDEHVDFAPGVRLRENRISDRKVGRVTSICRSPRAGKTIGLGFVRREVLPPAIVVLDVDTPANVRVVPLPFPSADADALFTKDWPRNGGEPEEEIEV